MTGVSLEGVTKRFGAAVAVDAVSLDVPDGGFLALLGPSGCGKTTILRMIAGFETVSEGVIRLGGDPVSDHRRHVPPEDRRVGIVFQSYALWPHMDVAANVAYPLKVRGIRGADLTRAVGEALAAVDLTGFTDRRPADLSGGQRQRVALARCLAMGARLVLLDEPLANLDVHLRASMEDAFRDFHARTGATMVYVTHDQSEAMTLASAVAVMDRGRIEQVAAPDALWREPATEMVAGFIGEGAVVPGVAVAPPAGGRIGVDLFGTRLTARAPEAVMPGPVRVLLRPEGLTPASASETEAIETTVIGARYRGGHALARVRPVKAPDAEFTVRVDGIPQAGLIMRLAVTDAWVLPPTADGARAAA